MLDAKIASALGKIIQNSQFNKKVSLEEQKAPKRGPLSARKTDRLHDPRRLSSDLVLMTQYWTVLIYSLLFFFFVVLETICTQRDARHSHHCEDRRDAETAH